MSAPPPPKPAAPPEGDPAKFMAETQAAMNQIMRARHDAGLVRDDPVDPLVQALARTVGVLGRLPAVLARRQHDAEIEAVQGMTAALQDALARLVNDAGATMAAKAKLRWLCITAVLLAGVFVGGWWIVADRAFTAGATSQYWHAEAAIAEARRALPTTMRWAAAITDEAAQERAIWAANTPALRTLVGLSNAQVQNLGYIVREADSWSGLRKASNAPWPCIAYEPSTRWSWNGQPTANVCITGYGN